MPLALGARNSSLELRPEYLHQSFTYNFIQKMRFLGPSEAEKHTQRTQSTKKGSAGLSRDLIEVMPLVTVSLQLSPASPACLQGQQLSAPPAARFPAGDSVRWGGRGYSNSHDKENPQKAKWCPETNINT